MMTPERSVLLRDLLCNTVGRIANTILLQNTRFIIISSGRAGSNYLNSLMKAHPRIVQHGEILGEFQLESSSVRQRINRAGVTQYLDQRLLRMTYEMATGIKLLYNNLEERYGQVRGVPGTGFLWNHILADDRIRLIHLVREDKLATLISHQLALSSHRWAGGSYSVPTVTLPVDFAREKFRQFEDWERRIASEVPADRLLQMTYERLTSDTEGELRRVFDFICLDPVLPRSQMKKQNDKDKYSAVDNMEELISSFSGTSYEKYFSGLKC